MPEIICNETTDNVIVHPGFKCCPNATSSIDEDNLVVEMRPTTQSFAGITLLSENDT